MATDLDGNEVRVPKRRKPKVQVKVEAPKKTTRRRAKKTAAKAEEVKATKKRTRKKPVQPTATEDGKELEPKILGEHGDEGVQRTPTKKMPATVRKDFSKAFRWKLVTKWNWDGKDGYFQASDPMTLFSDYPTAQKNTIYDPRGSGVKGRGPLKSYQPILLFDPEDGEPLEWMYSFTRDAEWAEEQGVPKKEYFAISFDRTQVYAESYGPDGQTPVTLVEAEEGRASTKGRTRKRKPSSK